MALAFTFDTAVEHKLSLESVEAEKRPFASSNTFKLLSTISF